MTATRTESSLVTDAWADLVTMLLGAWLMIGIFLDGYAHTNLVDQLESFFTPWHAVFYSGFLATSAWVFWIVYRNVRLGRSWREAIPIGYGPTVFGLGLFGLGGLGDGIWHSVFGIESGIDALLSPTHFMLFVGGLLGLSTAIRTTRARNPATDLMPSDRAPLILSLLLVTAALAFFAVYMWIPAQIWAIGIPYEEAQGAVGYVVAGALVATAVMVAPVLIVLRWWNLPAGVFLVIWPVVNAAIAVAFTMDLETALAFGIVGGVTGELLRRVLQPGPLRRGASLLVTSLAVATAWAACLIAFEVVSDILWPPEIWTGLVVLSGLATLGIAWIALPDRARGPAPNS
ncbi:MAG: hypothetical protein R3258_05305 [Acidimicrobiia bacterium]|nr:hypothetical protein [Acidimicrobiia bacterium]